jgi:hypothetical protein
MYLQTGTYILADMELWTTIHTLEELIPFKVVSRGWIKGHQDKEAEFKGLPFNGSIFWWMK